MKSKFFYLIFMFFLVPFFQINGTLSAQDFQGIIELENYTLKSLNSEKSAITKDTIYLSGSKMRYDEHGENTTTIVDLNKNTMIHINHNKKSYVEVSLQQLQEGMRKMQKLMEEAMKKMTPEQRKQMEEMGMKMPVAEKQKKYHLKNTGEKARINGYNCEKYLFTKGDEEDSEEWWITRDLGLTTNIGKMMAKMFEGIGATQGGEYEALTKLQGLPIKTIEKQNNKFKVSEVTKVTKKSLDSSVFAIPSGYTKESMPKMY